MRIGMRSRLCQKGLSCENWDLGVVGKAVDDRGRHALSCARASSQRIIEVRYDVEEMILHFGSTRLQCDELPEALDGMKADKVVLEATTLGFAEILLCCKALLSQSKHFGFLYLEPGSYNAPRRLVEVLARRDFELSESIVGFQGIPGATGTLDDTGEQLVVCMVGYEGARLDRAIHELPIRPDRCHIVFGVPAFQPGWEMDSFSNNVPIVSERGLSHGISFCGAANPRATMEVLERLFASQPPGIDFFLAPLGTKPHGIAAALFVCQHPEVGVLYDHPMRRVKRTEDIGRCHLFEVEAE